MHERGVFRSELFDGTAEYLIADSKGPVMIAHVASRVPAEFVEARLNETLSLFESYIGSPDGGSSLPVSSERAPLHLVREAAA